MEAHLRFLEDADGHTGNRANPSALLAVRFEKHLLVRTYDAVTSPYR